MKWLALVLALVSVATAKAQTLSLSQSGSGNTASVTVISSGQFELVWEAADNWGLSQWYDLVNDPTATTNLTLAYSVSGPSAPCFKENGLQNMTFYGLSDDKLDMFDVSSGCSYPTATPSLSIVTNTSSLVVLQSAAHPLSGTTPPDTNTLGTVTYYVYPNGKIYIHSVLSVVSAYDFSGGDLFIGFMDLNNPAQMGTDPPDSMDGWIRADKDSNPWDNSTVANEPYLFAYWDPTTPTYGSFTKASVLIVLSPNNTFASEYQVRHSWGCGTGCGVTRWGYRYSPGPSMTNGQSITNDYLIQLGTQGSGVLPNITTTTVATPIANAYAANPNPPLSAALDMVSGASFSGVTVK